MKPTTIVLTFNQPLDPTSREDVHEYHLVDPQGHIVPIKSAVYDPTADTVTLYPKYRINLHHTYKLTVDGATPSGLTDSSGLLLDGKKQRHTPAATMWVQSTGRTLCCRRTGTRSGQQSQIPTRVQKPPRNPRPR